MVFAVEFDLGHRLVDEVDPAVLRGEEHEDAPERRGGGRIVGSRHRDESLPVVEHDPAQRGEVGERERLGERDADGVVVGGRGVVHRGGVRHLVRRVAEVGQDPRAGPQHLPPAAGIDGGVEAVGDGEKRPPGSRPFVVRQDRRERHQRVGAGRRVGISPPREGGDDVGPFGDQRVVPLLEGRAEEVVTERCDPVHEELGVAVRDVGLLPGVVRQPSRGELANGLQHPEADPGRCLDRMDEGVVDEPVERVEHRERVEPVDIDVAVAIGGDGFGRVQRPSVHEDRQPTEERSFSRGEQVVAPGDRALQRLLPGQHHSGAAGEDAEGVVETVEDALRIEHAAPGGGQLDGQWDAVEPVAQLGDDRPIVDGEVEVGSSPTGPVAEQADGVELRQCLDGGGGGPIGKAQRWDAPRPLSREVEHDATRREDVQLRSAPEEPVDQGGDDLGDVLAVVHDQEATLVAELAADGLLEGDLSPLADSQRGAHGRFHAVGTERCELDPPHTGRELFDKFGAYV